VRPDFSSTGRACQVPPLRPSAARSEAAYTAVQEPSFVALFGKRVETSRGCSHEACPSGGLSHSPALGSYGSKRRFPLLIDQGTPKSSCCVNVAASFIEAQGSLSPPQVAFRPPSLVPRPAERLCSPTFDANELRVDPLSLRPPSAVPANSGKWRARALETLGAGSSGPVPDAKSACREDHSRHSPYPALANPAPEERSLFPRPDVLGLAFQSSC